MAPAFAALEARVNAAVARTLANRMVTVAGVSFAAIFEDAGAVQLDGLAESTEPRLSAVPAELAALLTREVAIAIAHPVTGEITLRKLARKEPDGFGFLTLYLRD